MINFLRPLVGGDHQKSQKGNEPTNPNSTTISSSTKEETLNPQLQMGQLSSSEVQAASTVGAGKAVFTSATAIRDARNAIEVQEKQNQGAKLAAMVRPSQPIDIQVGKGRSRAPEQIKCRQMPIGLAQTQKQQHQPKVIQPRRLSGSASVSLGPVYGVHGNFAEARNDLNGYRERVWQEAMRRRLLSLDSRTVTSTTIDPDCPSSSGENNKENRQQKDTMLTSIQGTIDNSEGSKKLNRSRKRLNDTELEFGDAEEFFSPETTNDERKEEQKIHEKLLTMGNGIANEKTTSSLVTNQQQQQHDNGASIRSFGRKRTGKSGGRIAYLYGVYGQERPQPYSIHSLISPQQWPILSDSQSKMENLLASVAPKYLWDNYCRDTPKTEFHECYVSHSNGHLEMDEREDGDLLLDLEQPVESLVRFHTVGDIIGYAKVVRAQRQETLGRLNEVMSQFDQLIRSYSMEIRSNNNNIANSSSSSNIDGNLTGKLEQDATQAMAIAIDQNSPVGDQQPHMAGCW